MSKRLFLFSLMIAFCFPISMAVAANRYQMSANEFAPSRVSAAYGTELGNHPADESMGDLTFVPYPAASSLSPEERFIIAGGSAGNLQVGSWCEEIMRQCQVAYGSAGHTPASITPEVLAEAGRLSREETATYSFFKNPITGQWPRCTASSPSPGDIYTRPLTDAEASHFAEADKVLKKLLQEGQAPGEGKGNWVPAKLIGKVWYLRAYGVGGRVIFNELRYSWYKLP